MPGGAGVALVAALGLSAYVLFGQKPNPADNKPLIVVPLPPPKPVEPPPLAVVDAGAPAVAEVKPAEPPPIETPAAPKQPAKPARGEVEVRVRPFAVLYVDGVKVGETPLKPLTLSAGKHSFRMVNEQVQKDVTVDFVVKPGKSVFKHNLLE